VSTVDERRERLTEVFRRARVCERCPELVATRTQVVFGAGNADADLMFIGEAPGRDEDVNGVPFVGRSGQLLTQLLEEVGLHRDDVFIANVLKCRPPDNRNPAPREIANCREYLEEQLALIQPKVVCTLGNFSTKLIRDKADGITKVRGTPEVVTIGQRAVRLLPLLHPAAALYTRSNIELLRADIGLIPGLLALEEPPQPAPPEARPAAPEDPERDPEVAPAAEAAAPAREPEPAAPEPSAPGLMPEAPPPKDQLGLF
jgi:DNA polymerase